MCRQGAVISIPRQGEFSQGPTLQPSTSKRSSSSHQPSRWGTVDQGFNGLATLSMANTHLLHLLLLLTSNWFNWLKISKKSGCIRVNMTIKHPNDSFEMFWMALDPLTYDPSWHDDRWDSPWQTEASRHAPRWEEQCTPEAASFGDLKIPYSSNK